MKSKFVSPSNFKTESSPNNRKYEEGLSILQLTYEDLDLRYSDQELQTKYTSPKKLELGTIEEKLLDEIEPKLILEEFVKLLDIWYMRAIDVDEFSIIF